MRTLIMSSLLWIIQSTVTSANGRRERMRTLIMSNVSTPNRCDKGCHMRVLYYFHSPAYSETIMTEHTEAIYGAHRAYLQDD